SMKCVLAGDQRVGKTCLLSCYARSKLVEASTSYVPTTFDNYAVDVTVEKKPIKVQICDTSGQDDLASLRSVWFSSTDVFLLCFSTADLQSFENIKTKWLPEVNRCSPDSPVVLVGLQTDRRNEETSNQHDFVSTKMAQNLANSSPCFVGYVEC
ncbi:hypothetical protein HELRODRAFT_122890, partial [Helobdella robusta]|uniref:Uncharacterized protein n=1 Tax=Helobdella robusta TaxID=6412 RepID=T1EGW3_HELRO